MSSKRILIAEDETMLGDMLQYELSPYVEGVSVARNGEEAIMSIERERPDLLLLDLLMPRKSGYEVLEYLQHHGLHIPVVILSNLSDPQEQQKCFNFGAKDFLIKSQIDPGEMWGKIEKYLR